MPVRLAHRVAGLGLAGVTTLGLAGGAVAAHASASPAPGTPAAAGAPASMGHRPMPVEPMALQYAQTLWSLRGAQLERTYMVGMIMHHKAAIAMAQLEVQRGKHPALKTMAHNIIAAQQHEVSQLTGWLKTWYGVTPSQAMARAPKAARMQFAEMDRMMAQMMAQLRRVPAGAAFDIAFMQRMVPHHQMAIIESQPAQSFAVHAPLQLTANNIVSSQESEVEQLLSWLKTW